MTHTYNINGMTCSGCQAKVQSLLSKTRGVKNVSIDLAKGEATINMDKHIATSTLKTALKDYPKYQLEEKDYSPSPLVEKGSGGSIDLAKGEATINMDTHIATSTLKTALKDYPKYQLEEKDYSPSPLVEKGSGVEGWIETYKPILLIFGYILSVTVLLEIIAGGFSWMRWMNNFMASFFLVFSL
jgi:copper chaperone CopZ